MESSPSPNPSTIAALVAVATAVAATACGPPHGDPSIAFLRPPYRLGLIELDGPTRELSGLCALEAAWLGPHDTTAPMGLDCPTSYAGAAFEAPGPGGGTSYVTDSDGPIFEVRIVELVTADEDHHPAACLLAIRTQRGWFGTSKVIDHCEHPDSGSGFHPIGGVTLVDLVDDSDAEVLIEAGERHTRPCADECDIAAHLSRTVCGVDDLDVPRCTPPVMVSITDDEGTHTRIWRIDRRRTLVVGTFDATYYEMRGAPVPGDAAAWRVDFE